MKWFVAPCLAGVLAFSTTQVRAEEAAGDWTGVLADELHVIVHIIKRAGGSYDVTLESPDQGSFILRANSVEVAPDHLFFTFPDIEASYQGVWEANRAAWVGTWSQAQVLPLTLSRGT